MAVDTKGLFERGGTGGKRPIEGSTGFSTRLREILVLKAVQGVATFVFAQDPACERNGEAEVR